MWERFDRFADDFELRAQQRVAQANSLRRNDGVTPEVWMAKVRVGFACDSGPTSTGSVLVLHRSSFVPPIVPPTLHDLPSTPSDLLDTLQEFDLGFDVQPSATWRLIFLPGDGEKDEWHFDHAEIQGADGSLTRVGDIGWVEELLPLRPVKPTGSGAAELDVELAPTSMGTDYGPVHEVLVPKVRKEAQSGLAPAQLLMGVNCAMGVGVDQDDALAVDWYEQAAARGYLAAQLLFGWMLASGRGVARDADRASSMWQRAAAQGLARAQCVLGVLAESGAGISRDFDLAFECQSRAAASGLAQAEYRLGRLFERGVGRPIDKAEAWHAYRRAAMHGVPDAFLKTAILPAQSPREPWPGEQRAKTAAWLRSRRSRAGEQVAAETALSIAELWDNATASGQLTSEQIVALVAGAGHRDALVWGTARSALLGLQRNGIDVSPVLLELCGHGSAKVRVNALQILKNATPLPTIRHLLAAGRADRSSDVRAAAFAIAVELRENGLTIDFMLA